MASWTPTADILMRVGAALGFDLMPSWSPATSELKSAGSVANNGRTPLVSQKVVEAVNRYSVPPDVAATYYAEHRGKGMVVGYSIGTQSSDAAPRTGTDRPFSAVLPIEIALVRVLDGKGDIGAAHAGAEEGTAAYDLDRVQDLVTRGFQERRATDFGVQTLSLESVSRLGVEGVADGWIGRTLEYEFQRNMKNITAT